MFVLVFTKVFLVQTVYPVKHVLHLTYKPCREKIYFRTMTSLKKWRQLKKLIICYVMQQRKHYQNKLLKAKQILLILKTVYTPEITDFLDDNNLTHYEKTRLIDIAISVNKLIILWNYKVRKISKLFYRDITERVDPDRITRMLMLINAFTSCIAISLILSLYVTLFWPLLHHYCCIPPFISIYLHWFLVPLSPVTLISLFILILSS